jgi:hypothetical protein
MYIDGYMLLVIYLFASVAFLASIWMFFTIEELKSNGKTWIKLNEELLKKVEQLENSSKKYY